MNLAVKRLKPLIAWTKEVRGAFVRSKCPMHAAGLTYFSMLAIVPILCVLLVAAKTLGVADYAERQLNRHIDAMIENVERGQDDELASFALVSEEEREKKRLAAKEFAAQARSISAELFDRVEKFDIGTLGWIGFGFLLWTVVSSVGMVEVSLNEIFEVAALRPIWLRAVLYLGLTVALPIIMAVILSLPVISAVNGLLQPSALSSALKPVFSFIMHLVDSWAVRGLVVFSSTVLAFSFLYWMLPNCRVRWRHALFGGILAAISFGGWLKACAVVQVGISRSSALYGSFAFLPIILAWFYISWQLFLLGACMTSAFDGAQRRLGR